MNNFIDRLSQRVLLCDDVSCEERAFGTTCGARQPTIMAPSRDRHDP